MSFVLGILYTLIIGAVVVSMTVLLIMGKKETYNKMYMGCQGMVAFWCISQILILLSNTKEELLLAYRLGNLGVCFVGAFWFSFALAYSGKKVPYLLRAVVFGVSAIHYLSVLTNDWHHLYYTNFSSDAITHGVLFYTNVLETYLFVIVGAIILYCSLERERKENGEDKKHTNAKELVIAAVLVPMTFNAFYLTNVIKATFDITPLGFGISGILVLLATFKYRFMEVNITAFDTILEGISDGVSIFLEEEKCTFQNTAFRKLFPKVKNVKSVLEYMQQMQVTDENVYENENGQYLQIQIYQNQANAPETDDSNYMDEVTEKDLDVTKPCVFVVKDISRYYELLRQTRDLSVANEKLALEQERNRIAQQVHDTAGHTLTMIQSYMKLASVSNENEKQQEVRQYLEDAAVLTSNGIKELRESINQLRKEAESELVTQGILQLADQVKEMPVEVTVQGQDCERYSHLSRILYDCVRESITNTLKYASASKMDIVLRFKEECVEVVIADDGVGCTSIQDNNGLSGIRNRVEKVEGTVRFITGENEGFLTRISIPVGEHVQTTSSNA